MRAVGICHAYMSKPSQLPSCEVGFNGLDAKSAEQSARPDVVVTGLVQVDPAHGAHGANYSLIEERMRLNSGLSCLV
jgi:hypothetical protein